MQVGSGLKASYPGSLYTATTALRRSPVTCQAATVSVGKSTLSKSPPLSAARSVTCFASSSFSGDKARSTPEKGYAFLHDFCLGIPYGVLLLGVGITAWFTSSRSIGVALGSAALLSLAFQALSLQCYQASKKSAPFTVATTGVSLTAAVFSWQNYQKGLTKIPSIIAVFLSAALGAFLLYNVAAGGNPPKGEKPLAEAAPHPTS